jgi:O-antigen ligase
LLTRFEQNDSIWALGAAACLAAVLVLGGTSQPAPALRFAFSFMAIAIIAASAWRLRDRALTPAAQAMLAMIAALVLLFAVQLLPLPPLVSGLLPGREPLREAAALAGIADHWQALSVSPQATREAFTALLPALAVFLAVSTVQPHRRYILALAIVAVAVVNVILALAQKFTGVLHLYPLHAPGDAPGLFANRNFFAAQLYASLPMLAALALAGAKAKDIPAWLAAAIAFAYCTVVMAGLAVSGSRTGIILCMAAVVGSFFFPWGRLKSHRMATRARIAFYVVALGMFLFGQFGLVGVLRLVENDPLQDYRSVILDVSLKALSAFWPVGSGFGTFVPVYQSFETPAMMREAYVNHAHNDWLEIVLEGGIPALLLLAAFVAWFGWQALRIWRRRGDQSGDLTMMAASLSAGLLLMHSAVDYPLRTPALMALLGMCLGLMAAPFAPAPVKQRQARPPIEAPVARKPLRPFQLPANEPGGVA